MALIVVCLRRPHCELQKGIPGDGDRPSRPVLNELIDVLHLNQRDRTAEFEHAPIIAWGSFRVVCRSAGN